MMMMAKSKKKGQFKFQTHKTIRRDSRLYQQIVANFSN